LSGSIIQRCQGLFERAAEDTFGRILQRIKRVVKTAVRKVPMTSPPLPG
jgi:hypothetical protein